jgi:hypothetical protein
MEPVAEEEGSDDDESPGKSPHSKQERFGALVKTFYRSRPYEYSNTLTHELEVSFGTKGVKRISRDDYDNVVRKLKSSHFTVIGENTGEYYLRIFCEFLNDKTGRPTMSNIRTEIAGLFHIQEYCRTNDIQAVYMKNPSIVKFLRKKIATVNDRRIAPVDFDDFNFRVSYKLEEVPKTGIVNFIKDRDNWKNSAKEFRFMNRVSFVHDDYPFIIDLSIVKFGSGRGGGGRRNPAPAQKVYNIDKSNVFQNPEVYEIEIEVDNRRIGPATRFNSPDAILAALRAVIKIVLSGLQGTNYPISYPEQNDILHSYLKTVWGEREYDAIQSRITSKYFLGPNSITLQLPNIAPIDENSTAPNIRKDFIVTEKADGARHLLYVSEEGKIYLINTNMDILFTGAKTYNTDCFQSIVDGELILHDKNGKFINLFAAFDIYYLKRDDVRHLPFLFLPDEEDLTKSRYQLLSTFISRLKPTSVLNTGRPAGEKKSVKALLKDFESKGDIISPIRIVRKEFFPNNSGQSIFQGCNEILQKIRNGLFEYNTDGLIFTHSYYGVGSDRIGRSGAKTRTTWDHSFKWKPPEYNTIDFLVTTVKAKNGEDIVNAVYEDGIQTADYVQYNQYKTLELRCGFSESRDGYLQPCQDIIDDRMPEKKEGGDDYLPKRFYPTEPYDPNAGICNIMLTGGDKMFSEEGDVFEDNTIVEFRYDLSREDGWRWVPLRVRHDKTAKLRRGEREYGNSYKTCNENWRSIHPTGRITQTMLMTGEDIPSVEVSEDKYYNTPAGMFKTDHMKNFHNLYVKRLLITGAAKPGDTLIDFACGKAGDLPKWIGAKLSFVFGVDLSRDNLENRLDGACARYLNMRKTNKYVPYALFVNGNSAYNIRDGTAMLNEKARRISDAVFGIGEKEQADRIGPGVTRQYQKGADGFNVSSCQFAIHYFFETPDTLRNFMRNVAECTKANGYFIGTCYDGAAVFERLRKTATGESVCITENDKKIWEITKKYTADTFEDNSSSIGYRIDVYQESINQTISEYLVNFDYLNRIMANYGFQIIDREEAAGMGLPSGSCLFSELFDFMLEEIARNPGKAKDYGQAPFMSSIEKNISFLNRYFVYKKVRNVNTETVELDLADYVEAPVNEPEEPVPAPSPSPVPSPSPAKAPVKAKRLRKKLVLVQEPVEEEPALVEEAAVEEPVVAEAAVEEPAVEEPAVEAVEEAAVEEPALVEPVEEPIVELEESVKEKKPRKPRQTKAEKEAAAAAAMEGIPPIEEEPKVKEKKPRKPRQKKEEKPES